MKIEQLLVQQLYNRKEVTLQGIGTFRLSDSVVLPADGDKDFTIPADGISFAYDSKAPEDPALIDFIVQQTGKIKPLASADLDSFTTLSKQFLNIGKPLRMEGIGTLLKNQSGQYDFTPGQYITPKIEPAARPLKEKFEDDISFQTKGRKPLNLKKWALALGLVAILGGSAYAVWWYFARKDKGAPVANTEQPKTMPDTAVQPDTGTKTVAAPPPDSANQAVTTAPATDGTTFKVIFKTLNNRPDALSRMNKLISWGHKVVLLSPDSNTYHLATPFSLPLSDTLRVSDSIRKLYGAKVSVVLN
jgi:hypothetical protein